MTILSGSMTQAQSGLLYYSVIGLLLLVFLYLWYGVRKDHSDFLPINQEFVEKGQKLFVPYHERFSQDIASGDKIFIQGKLSRKLQIGLKTVLWLLYLAIIIKLIAEMFGSEEHWHSSLILVFLIGIQVIQSLKTAYVLIRTKRNSMQYHPPIPKQPPYFDYKGERITPEQINQWKNTVYIWLPINILIFTLLIFSTYNLYFK